MNEQSQDPKNENLNTEGEAELKLMEIEKMSNEYALQGDYDRAKECKKQIKILQEKIREKKKQDLEQQHIYEMENLEQSYQQEIERINSQWNEKFQNLEARSQKAEETINERQSKEMEDLYAIIEDKLPKKVKFSKEYLTLDHQEKMLVKFEKFDEAKFIRKKKAQQKAKDIEKWNKEKTEKIKAQAIQKSNKHLAEKNVLKKKFETELDIMRKEKEKQLIQIEKKYQNKKLELEIQQKNEKILNENENISKKRQVGLNFFATENTKQHSRLNTHSNFPQSVDKNQNIETSHGQVDLEDHTNNIEQNKLEELQKKINDFKLSPSKENNNAPQIDENLIVPNDEQNEDYMINKDNIEENNNNNNACDGRENNNHNNPELIQEENQNQLMNQKVNDNQNNSQNIENNNEEMNNSNNQNSNHQSNNSIKKDDIENNNEKQNENNNDNDNANNDNEES